MKKISDLSIIKNITSLFVSSDSRTKLYGKNVLIMISVRAISVLISFLYVPLLLSSFDLADYGVFLTLTSIIGWFVLLDVGLSTGLRNQLTLSVANNDLIKSKSLVSTAYVAIFFYTLIISIIFYIGSKFINWAAVLNVSLSRETEMYNLAMIVFGSFCLNFFFGVINTIVNAMQVPFYTSIFNLIGQIVSFIIVYILVKLFNVNSLLFVSSIIVYVPVTILIVSSFYLFKTKFKFLAPSLSSFSRSYVKEIMGLGIKFFAIQIITLIIFQSNNFIILHAVNSEAVVHYSIGTRYFEVIAIIFTIVVTPVWSSSREAYIKNDFNWIHQTKNRLVYVATGIALIGVILLAISNWLFDVWLGENNIEIPTLSLGLILCFIVFKNYYQCFGYIINGTNLIKAQLLITSIVALFYIPCAYFFGLKFGINGVVIVLCLTQVINIIWSRYQLNKILNNEAKGIWNA
jgi:O-antigen/teichoic acid export membrane protein